jgi:hypothetical protein
MKSKSFLAIVLLALAGVAATPCLRSEETVKEKKVSKKDLAKYDADKDGQLNEAERALMKADKEKAKSERKAKKQQAGESAEPKPAETKSES